MTWSILGAAVLHVGAAILSWGPAPVAAEAEEPLVLLDTFIDAVEESAPEPIEAEPEAAPIEAAPAPVRIAPVAHKAPAKKAAETTETETADAPDLLDPDEPCDPGRQRQHRDVLRGPGTGQGSPPCRKRQV